MTVVINGSTGIDTVQDGVVTDTKLNLTANSPEIKEALNASNGAPIYACRAWVNFNGTGTVSIRASGNVSSITDNGTGDYTANFTNAMPDVNYVISYFGVDGSTPSSANFEQQSLPYSLSTNGCRVITGYRGSASYSNLDFIQNYMAVFR